MKSLVLVAVMCATANAMELGSPAPLVNIEGTNQKKVAVPTGEVTLIFYEDKDAGVQNDRTRNLVGPITDMPENKTLLQFMPIADLEKWNWFPAKQYALNHIAKVEKKEATIIYLDWHGKMRKAWKLTKGRSGIILLDVQGNVKFFGEGPLTRDQSDELVKQLAALGVKTQK